MQADNRTLVAFASYNAGPGNISKMRKEAVIRGLDPADPGLPFFGTDVENEYVAVQLTLSRRW